MIGAEPVVVGYECDGCELALENGLPVATGSDSTPKSFTVLGTAPAHLWASDERPANLQAEVGAEEDDLTGVGELNWVAQRLGGADTPEIREKFAYGYAVMGAFEKGAGEVFTTGCTDWAFGLDDPQVSQITRNVLDRFLKRG